VSKAEYQGVAAPLPTKLKLAEAIRQFNPALTEMIERAKQGYYDDYESSLAAPIMQLLEDLLDVGATALVERAMSGEFDGTEAEAMAWWEREGQYIKP
jgi:hypothetical protein